VAAQVQDVAQAMANLTQEPKIHSTTFNLPGPVTFNYAEMQKLISLFTFRPVSGVPEVPKRIAEFLSKLSQLIWWPSLSPDEIERRFIDDVMVDGAQDWAALGVNPIEVEKVATLILRRYRSGYVDLTFVTHMSSYAFISANYTRPVVLPGEGRSSTRSVSISFCLASCGLMKQYAYSDTILQNRGELMYHVPGNKPHIFYFCICPSRQQTQTASTSMGIKGLTALIQEHAPKAIKVPFVFSMRPFHC
jgi:hypothetical protein